MMQKRVIDLQPLLDDSIQATTEFLTKVYLESRAITYVSFEKRDLSRIEKIMDDIIYKYGSQQPGFVYDIKSNLGLNIECD